MVRVNQLEALIQDLSTRMDYELPKTALSSDKSK